MLGLKLKHVCKRGPRKPISSQDNIDNMLKTRLGNLIYHAWELYKMDRTLHIMPHEVFQVAYVIFNKHMKRLYDMMASKLNFPMTPPPPPPPPPPTKKRAHNIWSRYLPTRTSTIINVNTIYIYWYSTHYYPKSFAKQFNILSELQKIDFQKSAYTDLNKSTWTFSHALTLPYHVVPKTIIIQLNIENILNFTDIGHSVKHQCTILWRRVCVVNNHVWSRNFFF